MTEDQYPLRLAAATGNPRCVALIKLSGDLSEEEGIRPGISRVMPARCPFEVVPERICASVISTARRSPGSSLSRRLPA